jgi:hypothetical protein
MNDITRSPALDRNSLHTLTQMLAASAARFIHDVRSGLVQVPRADTAFIVFGREVLH